MFKPSFFILVIFLTLAGLMVYILVEPAFKGNLFVEHINGQTLVSDFILYYQSGKMAISSDAHKIYDPLVQLKWTNQLIYPDKINGIFYVNYVPFMFALLIPLTFFSIPTAYFLWCCLQLILAYTGLNLILKLNNNIQGIYKILLFLGFFISVPSIYCLKLGQSGYILLSLFCYYLYFRFKQNKNLSGSLLALTTIKPQYSLLPFLDLIINNEKKVLIAFIASEIILFLTAILNIGIKETLLFPSILLNSETVRHVKGFVLTGLYPTKMTNLRALVSYFYNDKLSSYISLLGIILFSLFFVFKYKNKILVNWYFAVLILASVYFSPHTYIHDTVLIFLPFVLTVKTLKINEIINMNVISEKIWHILLIIYPICSWACLLEQLNSPIKVSFLSFYNLGLLINAIFVFHYYYKHGQNYNFNQALPEN